MYEDTCTHQKVIQYHQHHLSIPKRTNTYQLIHALVYTGVHTFLTHYPNSVIQSVGKYSLFGFRQQTLLMQSMYILCIIYTSMLESVQYSTGHHTIITMIVITLVQQCNSTTYILILHIKYITVYTCTVSLRVYQKPQYTSTTLVLQRPRTACMTKNRLVCAA